MTKEHSLSYKNCSQDITIDFAVDYDCMSEFSSTVHPLTVNANYMCTYVIVNLPKMAFALVQM
jgi:hypothetical protein